MKVSKLIKILQAIKAREGDLIVYTEGMRCEFPLDENEISVDGPESSRHDCDSLPKRIVIL